MSKLISLSCTILIIASAANAGLIHRYSFNDGTAKDSVGKIDGTLKGDAKIAEGKLVLDNGERLCSDSGLGYLEFASSVIPKSGSVSLVVWITAKENPQFSRVIDIGDSENGEGHAFIYLVPRHEEDQSRAAITAADTGAKTYIAGSRLDDEKPHMAVIVIDGEAKKLHLYVDGKESAAEDLGDNTLDQVKPVHNWLGRSGFDADPGLSASIDEFRVYDHALSAEEVSAMQTAGPDALAAPSKP
jgi:hypothetical protein